MDPQGRLMALVFRPLNDAVLWLWRLERRIEFLYRPLFDRWLRWPIFAMAQTVQNLRREHEGLGIAEERTLYEEEECIQAIIDEATAFTRQNWPPGEAQRFGNTKTYGVVRAEFTVLDGLPEHLARGLFASPATYPAWVRFAGPGPLAPPDLDDFGQCSIAMKLMGVRGEKLLDDETGTQDFILISGANFITPNVRENAKLQKWVRAKAPIVYAIKPGDSHLLHLFMQVLYSGVQANPLELQYYSNVPFLLGDGQAVQYSLKPVQRGRTRIPVKPSRNYLREAIARTLATQEWEMEFMVQVQTDPFRMPLEDATVKWPERLSPYVPVARLTLRRQRFESDEQLAFADVLRYNPWHSLREHRPLGNNNRARRRIYTELAAFRQQMNSVKHVEPDGSEQFPGFEPTSSKTAGQRS